MARREWWRDEQCERAKKVEGQGGGGSYEDEGRLVIESRARRAVDESAGADKERIHDMHEEG